MIIDQEKSNQLWIQYTPGAGGRFTLVCCTTAENVGNWLPDPLPDPVEYTLKKFCGEDGTLHMKTETQPPYNIPWYTRQYPFTRGDNLTPQEVTENYMQDPTAKQHLLQNKLLANPWNKTYLPDWFNGKLLTIVSDENSHKWLMERRKQVFYRFKNGKAYLLRYMPDVIHNPDRLKMFKDHPQTEYDYTDQDKFVESDYHDKMEPGKGLNITLTDVLNGDPNMIWDQIDALLEMPIDRNWCTPALNTWRNRWAKG